MNLDAFIAGPYRNEWIAEPGLSYYVRKSMMFPGVIELSNCSADGTVVGAYWRFLRRYAARVPFYAEQVINDDLAAFYRRLGWLERDGGGGIPHFASPLMVERCHDTKYFFLRFPDWKP